MLKILCHINLISFQRGSLYWFGGFGHSLDENGANRSVWMSVWTGGWDGWIPRGLQVRIAISIEEYGLGWINLRNVCIDWCYPSSSSSQPPKVAPFLIVRGFQGWTCITLKHPATYPQSFLGTKSKDNPAVTMTPAGLDQTQGTGSWQGSLLYQRIQLKL